MPSALLPSAVSMLEKLVSFDTTSRNSNLELIEFVDGYLQALGATTETIYSEDKNKANLLARIGPDVAGGVVLSGHTDVVPVDDQDWASDPFALVEKEQKLFGRGTSDMKGFIAVALAIAPEFAKQSLKKPVYFALSYDEEVGCLGAHDLAKTLAARANKPDIAIIGEPTEMRVINRHKSVCTFDMTVTGHEAHSSAVDKGVSAIFLGSKIINFIGELQESYIEKAKSSPDSKFFDPPFTTMQVGVINGGTAHNIIPHHCHFEWEIRSLPEENTQEIVDKVEHYAATIIEPLKVKFPNVGVENIPGAAVPGLKANVDSSIENLLMSLAGTNQVEAVSFATEAGIFQSHDIPAIICGPGSIMQAHKPNEFIEISQLDACIGFVEKLVAVVNR